MLRTHKMVVYYCDGTSARYEFETVLLILQQYAKVVEEENDKIEYIKLYAKKRRTCRLNRWVFHTTFT